MTMRRAAYHCSTLLAFTIVLVAVPSGAAAVTVRGVDATAYPTLGVTVVTEHAVARSPRIFEGRVPVAGVRAQNLGAAKSVVLAVDRSRSMQGRPLADAVSAARLFLAAKSPVDRASIVSFGADALELTRFASDTGEADAALARLAVDRHEGTALYDGVGLAVRALASETQGGRLVVILSDGRDLSSSLRLQPLIEAARRAHVLVYAIGIETRGFAAAPLRRLATRTGGRYVRAASSADLARIYGTIAAELRRTWRLEYATASRPGRRLHLRVAVPGQGAAAAAIVLPGGSTGGGEAGPRGVGTVWADLLLALVVGALVVLAGRSVGSYGRANRLRRRLQPESGPRPGEPRPALRERLRGRTASLFDATERTFGRRARWQALERMLNQADLPLRVVELLYGMLAGAFAFAFLALLLGFPFLLSILLFAAGALVPLLFVRLKARRRMRDFDEQLPDLLMTLASSLKAGHSFRQGLQTIADESRDPARKEFQRVLSEARLGRTLDDALADMAVRLGSENFAFVVSAVTIQRRVGGSLAGIFDMVADSVRRRQLFGRRLKALTAQGRLSAYVLMALPVFLGLALTAINPGYMAPLFGTSAGHVMLLGGVLLMAIGGLLLKRIAAFAG